MIVSSPFTSKFIPTNSINKSLSLIPRRPRISCRHILRSGLANCVAFTPGCIIRHCPCNSLYVRRNDSIASEDTGRNHIAALLRIIRRSTAATVRSNMLTRFWRTDNTQLTCGTQCTENTSARKILSCECTKLNCPHSIARCANHGKLHGRNDRGNLIIGIL